MDINENLRNESKIVEKLRGVPTKLPIFHLLHVCVLARSFQRGGRGSLLYYLAHFVTC